MSLVKLVREAWMYWRLYYSRLDTCICRVDAPVMRQLKID